MANASPEKALQEEQNKKRILALMLKKKGLAAQSEAKPALIPPRADQNDLALSNAQQRLWFLEEFTHTSSAYVFCNRIDLTGPIDVEALGKAFQALVDRHEIVRTSYQQSDGVPRQQIQAHVELQVPCIELQKISATAQQAELRSIIEQEYNKPFDLTIAPLMRLRIIKLSDTQHVVLQTLHHIVYDGWSLAVMYQEVKALYEALIAGKGNPLVSLDIQYADYAAWLRKKLQTSGMQHKLAFWQETLAGELPVLELPIDKPRPASQSYNGALHTISLPADLGQSLKAFAANNDSTIYMVLMTAFKILLHRYTGETDIIVGTPVANRPYQQTEKLIGFFVNSLALRTSLESDPTVIELLTRVRTTATQAYNHQEVPFDQVVDSVNLERDISHNPIFQVMFAFQNTPDLPVRIGAADFSLEELDNGTSLFDLTFNLHESSAGVGGYIEYCTDLFHAQTIARMASHFENLLQSIVAQPHCRVSQLEMLAAEERQQLLVDWNDTKVDYPVDRCIHQLIEEQASLQPEAVAVCQEDKKLGYAELNGRANQLARYLQSKGIEDGKFVGVYMERSVDMLVSILAVIKAGGAYLPLDPDYPAERLAFMLEDTAAEVLITRENLIHRLPMHKAGVVCLDSDEDVLAAQADENLNLDLSPDSLVYIIYTSGSTGTPKGVMVAHRNLVNSTLARIDYYPHALRRFLLLSSFSFDSSVAGIFWSLCAGGELHLPKQGLEKDIQQLATLVQESQVTHLLSLPSIYSLLLSIAQPRQLDSLNTVIVAGEAFAIGLRSQHENTLPNADLYNEYGPTEGTVWSTVYKTTITDNDQAIPIGKPVGNVKIYLLDQNMQPVPVGVTGEIYIAGAGITRGYLQQDDLTAEKFIVNPFSSSDGRMYKTGDLARYLPDGNIMFLGRTDHQVKIRGYRIELGEIEVALAAHTGVEDAVVVAREKGVGARDAQAGSLTADKTVPHPAKRLIAYIVANDSVAPTVSEIRKLLNSTLPDYMVPQTYIFLDTIPLSPNGKININALPEEDQERFGTQADLVSPANPIEEQLVNIWSAVLGTESISTRDNFFEIGGDSLLSIQVVARAKDAGIDIAPKQIFQCLTIAELARVANTEQEIAIPLRDRAVPALLSFSQQRLWFLDRMDPDNAVYNVPMAYRLEGQLNVAAMIRSLNEIVRRHEVLRTTFFEGDDAPLQVVHEASDLEILVLDLSSRNDRDTELREYLGQQATLPFDLAQGPLIRCTVIKLGERETVLSMVLHHAVFDGWSVDVLLQELSCLYEAYVNGASSPLAELPIQYSDYSQWQRDMLRGEELERQLGFWKEHLQGDLPLLTMPCDFARPSIMTYKGALLTARLPISLATRLATIGRQRDATSFMVFFAAYLVLLYRYSGDSDLIVGVPIANRNHTETLDLIGLFVNTLAIRTRFTEPPTFNELIDEVRKNCLSAYAHQDLPFERLVEELQLSRDPSRTPVFQTLFSFEMTKTASFGDLELQWMNSSADVARTDLCFHLEQGEEFLEVAVEYSTDLFAKDTIERLVEHFEVLLEGIIADPNAPLSTIPLMGPREKQLFLKWNETETDYPLDQCIHHLFEAQVKRTPEAIAVVYDGQSLTYQQLEERANQLAHYLQEHGVAVEQLVGVFMERSLEMVIALYGILKAGGAYIPLDPDYPQDRIAFMLQDTRVSIVLTQKHLQDKIPAHAAKLVCLDQDWGSIATHRNARLNLPLGGNNLAYVIYTSGSTGKPKGVMNNHSGIVNLVLWTQETFHLTAKDRIPQITPFSFDASVWEFFWPLLTGACLVVAKPEGHKDPAYLAAMMVDERITTLQFVPSMLRLFLEQEHASEAYSIRQVFCGGEALSKDIQDRFFECYTDTALYNLYGPTEATVDVTAWTCERGGTSSIAPIGKPHANTQCYVLDEAMQQVPVGVAGELHIGGAQVARGYLNREELTAERFIDDPFNNKPGARLYKTGDLVRYAADGVIDFIGRKDFQVKVRGLRIELGEIESVLSKHDSIDQCIVIVREDRPDDIRLVAYVVFRTDKSLTVTEVRRNLRKQLPEHMVPQHVVHMTALPLTTNGKIDRHKLPSPSGQVVNHAFDAPETSSEIYLAENWSKLLGVEQVSISDNFFDLGGHSLLAAKMVTQVKKETGYDIPLQEVLLGSLRSLSGQYFPAGWDTAANQTARIADDADNAKAKPRRFFRFFERFHKRAK